MFGTKFVKLFTSAVICAFTFINFTQSSSATVVDFETLIVNNNEVNDQGNSYSEDGFTIDEIGSLELDSFGTN